MFLLLSARPALCRLLLSLCVCLYLSVFFRGRRTSVIKRLTVRDVQSRDSTRYRRRRHCGRSSLARKGAGGRSPAADVDDAEEGVVA